MCRKHALVKKKTLLVRPSMFHACSEVFPHVRAPEGHGGTGAEGPLSEVTLRTRRGMGQLYHFSPYLTDQRPSQHIGHQTLLETGGVRRGHYQRGALHLQTLSLEARSHCGHGGRKPPRSQHRRQDVISPPGLSKEMLYTSNKIFRTNLT